MRVAVAGGTGMIGKLVVDGLTAAGHEPVVLARSRGVDLTTGEGLADKLTGVEEIVDVTNVLAARKKQAIEFFATATRNLVEAATEAGARHVITLSIVGLDDVGLGYYLGKRKQEEIVRDGGVPWTIQRATQFHQFPEPFIDGSYGPFVIVPKEVAQPVAAQEVADTLTGLVGRPAAGYARELAGPEQLQVGDMTRRLVKARGSRKIVVPVRVPGATGKAMVGGGLLPKQEYTRGTRTFAQYLSQVRRDAAQA